jgi:hypothetical protein
MQLLMPAQFTGFRVCPRAEDKKTMRILEEKKQTPERMKNEQRWRPMETLEEGQFAMQKCSTSG